MKILNPQQTRQLDQYTIQNEPISSIDLMERAAHACTDWLLENIFYEQPFCVFAGTGNNGGDGLAIARKLNSYPFKVKVFLIKTSNKLSKDAQTNLERLQKEAPNCIQLVEKMEDIDFCEIDKNALLIDALFGSGLNRPLEGLGKWIVEQINQLPNQIISIDMPSGLFAEYDKSSRQGKSIVKAHTTLSFQLPKLSFFLPESSPYVGHWQILDIGLLPSFMAQQESPYRMVGKKQIQDTLKTRAVQSHKGNYGHALLIAGSYGKMGAAILASKACMRSGVGLLTAHIPHWGYNIIQTTVPEAMTSIDRSEMIFTEFPDLKNFNAIGIGPGLNKKRNSIIAFENLLNSINGQALIIDADGLNILSENKHLLQKLPKNTILTPHPKELERLVGSWDNDMHKLYILRKFCQQYGVITVLKGAYTISCDLNGTCHFNTTGNPGMATAGSGDALTGVILALLAQGYKPLDAAVLGVYLHGTAGDIALEKQSQESLIASDIISCLGAAFKRGRLGEV